MWSIDILADRIVRQLEWQKNMSKIKEEKRIQGMIRVQARQQKKEEANNRSRVAVADVQKRLPLDFSRVRIREIKG